MLISHIKLRITQTICTKFNQNIYRPGSSSLAIPPNKRKMTGSIPRGGTQSLLFIVKVFFPELVIKMLLAFKVESPCEVSFI